VSSTVCELHGIVLCSDTQITFPECHKYYEHKIYPHTNPSWSIAFTYAGSPNLMKMFNEKFATAPETGYCFQCAVDCEGARRLSGMNVLDSDSYGLHLLCAIVIPEKSLVVEDGRENCSGGSVAL
jgi:hypothetical protein